jgi:hypothetical protein
VNMGNQPHLFFCVSLRESTAPAVLPLPPFLWCFGPYPLFDRHGGGVFPPLRFTQLYLAIHPFPFLHPFQFTKYTHVHVYAQSIRYTAQAHTAYYKRQAQPGGVGESRCTTKKKKKKHCSALQKERQRHTFLLSFHSSHRETTGCQLLCPQRRGTPDRLRECVDEGVDFTHTYTHTY